MTKYFVDLKEGEEILIHLSELCTGDEVFVSTSKSKRPFRFLNIVITMNE